MFKINFWSILGNLIKGFFNLIVVFIPPFIFIVIIFIVLFLYHYFRLIKLEKIKPQSTFKARIKEPGFFTKIFWLFPKQLAYDKLMQDPNSFDKFGIHMICGRQGAGKTVTAVYLAQKWRNRYTKALLYTNFDILGQDGEITHWKDLIARNNGIYGVINIIDEIQTWFSNAESANIPPEMLSEISQQRKQKKAIVGTAQVFSRLAKPLREQTHYVYLPKTYLGSLTIVKIADVEDYDIEKDKFKKSKGMFFFIHTKELRESYDTFKKIERYKDTKFVQSVYSGSSSPMAKGSE